MATGKAQREREVERQVAFVVAAANATDADKLIAAVEGVGDSMAAWMRPARPSAREYNAAQAFAKRAVRWAATWPTLSVAERVRRVRRINYELYREKIVAPVAYELVERRRRNGQTRWKVGVATEEHYYLRGAYHTVVYSAARLIERVDVGLTVVGRCEECRQYFVEGRRRGPRRRACLVCSGRVV